MAMARFNHIGIEDIIKELNLEEERIQRNGPAALEAAAKIAIEAMQITVPRDTGGLAESIGYIGIDKGTRGVLSVEVYPQGRKKQTGKYQRYADIGFTLEYGRSNDKLVARHWMEDAYNMAKDEILDTLKTELMKD